MNYSLSSSLLLSLLLVQACGDSDSKSVKLRQPPLAQGSIADLKLQSSTEDARLLGTWSSPCRDNGIDGSTMSTLSMTADSMVQVIRLHNDRNCMTPILDMKVGLQYEAKGNQFITVTRLFTTTIRHQAIADAASRASSCGFNSWSKDVEYNVLDTACPKGAEGVNYSGNISGARNVFPYKITAKPGLLTLALEPFTFVREVADEASQSIFQEEKYRTNERLLRLKGCEVGLTFGLRNCPQPKNLAEAAELFTQVQRFSLGFWNDPNFKDDKAAQSLLQTGYMIELNKIFAYAPYKEAEDAFAREIAQLKTQVPQLKNIGAVFEVNVVDAMKGLKILAEVAKQPTFVDELARLKVDNVMFYDRFGHGRNTEPDALNTYYLYWDHSATADANWAQMTQTKTP